MLVVMQRDATTDQVAHVVKTISEMGLMPHPLPGATRTAIGITELAFPGALVEVKVIARLNS